MESSTETIPLKNFSNENQNLNNIISNRNFVYKHHTNNNNNNNNNKHPKETEMSSSMATENNFTNSNPLKFENNNSVTRSETNEAYVLLSLHSAPTSPSNHQTSTTNWSKDNDINHKDTSIVARLETRGSEYLIREKRTIIGRNSSRGKVDVSMGHSNFISRRHLEIFFEPPNSFFLCCKGKNGVFVDETFQRKGLTPFKLPPTCVLRFPSTNIRLEFQSLIPSHKNQDHMDDNNESEKTKNNFIQSLNNNRSTTSNNNGTNNDLMNNGTLGSMIYRPLKVNIPEIVSTTSNSEFVSPTASPTGTISAANSCPASPRSSNTVRFRFNNHPSTNNHNHQEEFQNMVAYATAAMSKEENDSMKSEPLSANNGNQNINSTNNIANMVSTTVSNNLGKNEANKNVPSTSKVFQLSQHPQSTLQYAQTHGTPIIASISNSSPQGIIINNGSNFIKNGQIIQTLTPLMTTPSNKNHNHSNSNDLHISKSSHTPSQSPPHYSLDISVDDDGKPPYSYAQLIVQAIASAHDRQLTLSGIYSFITKNYPYYRTAEKGWQNSIRHNLSLNRYFLKVPRSQSEPGKGSFWRIDPSSETKLIEQSMKRRRQRPNTGCVVTESNRNPSRSAPTSPSNSGFVSGLVTPDSLSREPSPSPSQENIESEIISTGFNVNSTIVTPTYLAMPNTENVVVNNLQFYSSKSAPGSPRVSGDSNKDEQPLFNSQHSENIKSIPIAANSEFSTNNGLPLPQPAQITYPTNGNKMILERHLVSTSREVQQNNANEAATAAAIALTNLQNKYEIHPPSQPSTTQSPTTSAIIQPTVIVQAPSTTATQSMAGNNNNLNLSRVVICQPTAVKSTPMTKSISKPEISPLSSSVVTSNLSSTVTTTAATIISRPIDLLTSAALAAANDDSKSQPSSLTTLSTSIAANLKTNTVENSVKLNISTTSGSDDSKLDDVPKQIPLETPKRDQEDISSETDETTLTAKRKKIDDNV